MTEMLDPDLGSHYGPQVAAWVERRVDTGVPYDTAWREAMELFPQLAGGEGIALPEGSASQQPAA